MPGTEETPDKTTGVVVLKFDDHHKRLGNIISLVRFLDRIIKSSPSLPQNPSFDEAQQRLINSFVVLGKAVSPPHAFDPEELRASIQKWVSPTEESHSLVYSLSLVMLVTQVEIFIEHLIETILLADPRRLKTLAGEKQLTSNEIVDARDYDTVMARLREKVSEEVIGASTRDMLEKHLGRRLGLFDPKTLKYETLSEASGKEKWDISQLEKIWQTRHQIVHEGRLDITELDFERAIVGCAWLESFLARRAQVVYGLTIESERHLQLVAGLFENSGEFLLDILLIQWATVGLLGGVVVNRPSRDED